MVKYVMLSLCVIGTLFGASGDTSSPDSSGQSPMHKLQQRHPDKLPNSQRHVMYSLSPSYQRIYLYALTDDQRDEVAMYEQKVENPYAAIDRILRRDRERTDRNLHTNCSSPCQKTKFAGQRRRYMHAEEEVALDVDEDQVLAVNPEDDVEIYDETDAKAASDQKMDYSSKVNKVDTTVKSGPVKKEMTSPAKKACTSCGKTTCCSKRTCSGTKKSLFSRCKEYFSKEEKVQTCKKYQYVDPNAEKRRQRSQQVLQY